MTTLEPAKQTLRARYVEGMPAKWAVLDEALDAWRKRRTPDPDDTLRRLAHQIRAAAAGFGFTKIDDAATRVEHPDDQYDFELASQSLIAELRQAYEHEPHAPLQVLVIDDDPFIGMFMTEILRADGVRLEQVTSAAAALAKLESTRWDLVFVDLVLPDADGRTLLTTIRELPIQRDASVLVLSSKAGSLVRNECYQYGIDGFLQKPIDPTTFPVLVTAVLERARSLRTRLPTQILETAPLVGSDARSRRSLLVVEDGLDLADLLLRDLAEEFEVTHAPDAVAALAAAHQASFDLVLLDHHMPPDDEGIEVVRELRKLADYRHTPIVVLTGFDGDGSIEVAFAAGADDYIRKPHTRRSLLARIHRHIDRSALAPHPTRASAHSAPSIAE
ncbi:response regulator [Nannocystaceae bacterium ST9]